MPFIDDREKWLVYAFFALYILGWIFGHERLLFALLSFSASAVCALASIPREAENRKWQQKQVGFALVMFILPALYAFWGAHKNDIEADRFHSYLSAHQCKYVGYVVTGVTNGGCDRWDNCEDPQEIEEPEYLCAATKKHITQSDFEAGRYKR